MGARGWRDASARASGIIAPSFEFPGRFDSDISNRACRGSVPHLKRRSTPGPAERVSGDGFWNQKLLGDRWEELRARSSESVADGRGQGMS